MKKTTTNKFFVYLMVFMTALLLIAAVIAVSLLVQLSEIKREEAELIARIEELYSEKESRKGEIEYMNSLDWAEKKARALGLIEEGDEIWKLIGK